MFNSIRGFIDLQVTKIPNKEKIYGIFVLWRYRGGGVTGAPKDAAGGRRQEVGLAVQVRGFLPFFVLKGKLTALLTIHIINII
jgi:hypothetical protein